ncbi:unnamed protein product [Cladocopium goreaui]|uniref:Uncharacterized protein n=1 Tax=Cladocopium goreaui TaxID=2562237 RepID=A0A9P1D885_9DINO|nr:unnamed protein product [Cladocopium goreaui]
MSRRVLLPFFALLAIAVLVPCFVGGGTRSGNGRALRAPRQATTSQSVALVQVTKENTIATAGVLGGVTGLLLGGFWIGAAGFVATSYLAKKEDDDVSTVLKGVSSASLEALNFVDYLNQKYEVSGKVGAALSGALDSTEGETSSSVKSTLGTVNGAIDSFDKDIGIRETLGGLVLAGSDLANQLATKVVELNKEYKVTDQLKSKIDEAVASSKS